MSHLVTGQKLVWTQGPAQPLGWAYVKESPPQRFEGELCSSHPCKRERRACVRVPIEIALVTAVPTAALLNPAGTVHGGFTATLLDSCMGLAVQSTLEKGASQTTLEFKISLVRPITPETGLIKAEGVVLNRGRRIGTAEGRVTDDKGRLLAHGTTTCLIF